MSYPLGSASRLSGVSPDRLRAWERRYGAVSPARTPGGTRRYRASDVERLRLLRACVDNGHRIGSIAKLPTAELRRRAVSETPAAPAVALADSLDALERLDATGAERLMAVQLAALGPVAFAHHFAGPLLREIGERWSNDSLCIASEHLGTSLLRVMLGAALRPTAVALEGPTIVFATPPEERHELGLQMVALTAMGAGANPLYLGTELPPDELVGAAVMRGASAVALGLVTLGAARAERAVAELQPALPPGCELWVGGPRVASLRLPAGVVVLEDFDAVAHRVAMLRTR